MLIDRYSVLINLREITLDLIARPLKAEVKTSDAREQV